VEGLESYHQWKTYWKANHQIGARRTKNMGNISDDMYFVDA
jgi:hypothetical protein